MLRVLPQVIKLVEARPKRTIFTRFLPPPSADIMPGAWRRYYERWDAMTLEKLDQGLIALVPELARFIPPAGFLDKRVYSPRANVALHAGLQSHGVNTIIVSGAETEVCVLATVLGAVGYPVIIATDAVCSSADSSHDAMLEIYHSRYGMQVETAEVEEILDAT
jgi:nicotinamidase-related amidase